jgi:hypothetical protein
MFGQIPIGISQTDAKALEVNGGTQSGRLRIPENHTISPFRLKEPPTMT